MIASPDVSDADRFTRQWWGDILLDVPLRLAGLILIAIVVRFLLHKIINRLVARTVEKEPPAEVLGSRRAARIVFGGTGAYSERRALRAETMGSVLRSVTTVLIGAVTVIMALETLGYSVGPLLASAGVAGVALGFGAQNLVKDFLAGAAMLLEDQYGVGDVIDMGHAMGTVESVSLRITRLRSVDGTVWYVRNGEVVRLGNSSYGWSRAVLDIEVGHDADIARMRQLLEEISHGLAEEEGWHETILEEPEVWGVEELSPGNVVIRLVVKTKPLEQWRVARELRERIKTRFDEERLELPTHIGSSRTADSSGTGGGTAADADPAVPPPALPPDPSN